MRFTAAQYDEAIENLRLAKEQLEPDGNCCSVCGGDHIAFECPWNPLVAVKMCIAIADDSEKLHETLHLLSGYDFHMGEQLGPRRIIMPEGEAT